MFLGQEKKKLHNYSVYILLCSDESYYTGITNDLAKRLERHNKGKASKYTRSRLPVKIIAFRSNLTKSQALRLEYKVKKQKKKNKLEFLKNYEFTE
jgi:putative endonuclease